MHIDRRFLGWGVFFIALGGVPLAVQLGAIDVGSLGGLWRLWPLFIIAIGIGILLKRTPLDFVGGVLSAATFGLILGGLLAGGFWFGSDGGAFGGPVEPFAGRSGTFSGPSARVHAVVDWGDLTIETSPGSAWTLGGSTPEGRPPTVTESATALDVRSPNRSGIFLFGDVGRAQMDLTVPADVQLDLAGELNAGSAHYDLSGAHLGQLDLTGNAGSLRVDLSGAVSVGGLNATMNAGDARISLPSVDLTGSLTVNAGRLGFCAPAGVGVRFTTGGSTLAGNNFADKGLEQVGDAWQTAGYATAQTKIDLHATANAGRLEFDPEGGCK